MRFAPCTLLLAAAALGWAGCDGAPEAAAPAAAPAAAGAAAATADPLVLWAKRMPDSLTHRTRGCPPECCVYGTWTGTIAVPLRAEPLGQRPPVHTIPAGQRFTADSGFVRVVGLSILTLEDSVDVGPTVFAAGDTVAVLDYIGEGQFNVWDGEKLWQIRSFWGQSGETGPEFVPTDGQYAREWWVHATTSDGRKGWIAADSVPTVKEAGECAG